MNIGPYTGRYAGVVGERQEKGAHVVAHYDAKVKVEALLVPLLHSFMTTHSDGGSGSTASLPSSSFLASQASC